MIDRKTFIGSSDVSAIMGLNPWKTSLQLWAEKTGRVEPKDLSDNEAVELGTELEDFVAKKFERKTGLKVRRAPKIYAHKDFPHFRCQVDRLIEGTDELLEVKTCSAWLEKDWDGEDIPEHYILQVIWQLGITGRHLGHIAVLIGGQKFRYKKIIFDRELFEKLISHAVVFWEYVKNGIMPLAVGADNSFIQEIYPTSDDEIQEAQELQDAIALRQETVMHINSLMAQKDEVEAKIKQRIGEKLGIKTEKYTVTWKGQVRTCVDTAKLKEDGLYGKYTQTQTVRAMRVRTNKEAENVNINSGAESQR